MLGAWKDVRYHCIGRGASYSSTDDRCQRHVCTQISCRHQTSVIGSEDIHLPNPSSDIDARELEKGIQKSPSPRFEMPYHTVYTRCSFEQKQRFSPQGFGAVEGTRGSINHGL